MIVPMGSIPEADKIGSMWVIPAFMALAAISTSGTKIILSRNLIPTIAIPEINPSSRIVLAVNPSSRAFLVNSSTECWSPIISL